MSYSRSQNEPDSEKKRIATIQTNGKKLVTLPLKSNAVCIPTIEHPKDKDKEISANNPRNFRFLLFGWKM